MVGEEIAANYRIENHHGKVLEEHDYLGTTPNGVPVWLDSRYVRADLKITTGLIEPHLMAGYSGGRKVICPGIAAPGDGQGLARAALPGAPEGGCRHRRGQPGPRGEHADRPDGRMRFHRQRLHRRPAARDLGRRRRHDPGVGSRREVRREASSRCRCSEPVDVVLTSCAGYPLDTTWYQAVKGLTGALPIVKKGGHHHHGGVLERRVG